MVINTSLPVSNPSSAKTSSAKPAPQVANDPANGIAALEDPSIPEISTPDEAQQSIALLLGNILNQSNAAIQAHSNLSPETAYSLVQP